MLLFGVLVSAILARLQKYDKHETEGIRVSLDLVPTVNRVVVDEPVQGAYVCAHGSRCPTELLGCELM